MVSNLKVKLATVTLLALTLIAISIPVMATVIRSGGDDTIKNCATASDDDNHATVACGNDTAASPCGAANESSTPESVCKNNTTSTGQCSGGSLTAPAGKAECAQAIRSCDTASHPAANNVCNGSKICNGSKCHKICNGSKDSKICNGSKCTDKS